jgi:hypothetical protein
MALAGLATLLFVKEGTSLKIHLNDGEGVSFRRLFVIGIFKGSMRRLLLRSDKTKVNPTRIDVLFMNTQPPFAVSNGWA